MNTELNTLIKQLESLIQAMTPQARRRLNQQLARNLRTRNAERIKANTEPDGSAMQARQSDRWQMSGLKENQTIRPGQRFHHFKQRNLTAAYVRDEGDTIIVRHPGQNQVQGYLKKNIYLQGGRLRQKMLFQKLPRTRYLKTKTSPEETAIGFMHGFVGRIAHRQHHGEPSKNLPARELLGLSESDIRHIQETLIAHLAQTA